MMNNMMDGAVMDGAVMDGWLMGGYGILTTLLLILGVAALVKYLFFTGRRGG